MVATRAIKAGHYLCEYVCAPPYPITEEKVREVEERYDADDIGKFWVIHRLRDF